jgi:hypothetical protein
MVNNKTAAGNKQATTNEPAEFVPLTAAQKLKQTLLDSYDLEELLHVCRSTLYNWRRKELLPHIVIGSKIYYQLEDVEALLQKSKRLGHKRK